MEDSILVLKQDEVRPHWERKIKELFEGRIVKIARYMDPDEVRDTGWSYPAVVLQLEDPSGKKEPVVIFPSADDEGNEAGALFTTDPDMPTVPVLR